MEGLAHAFYVPTCMYITHTSAVSCGGRGGEGYSHSFPVVLYGYVPLSRSVWFYALNVLEQVYILYRNHLL